MKRVMYRTATDSFHALQVANGVFRSGAEVININTVYSPDRFNSHTHYEIWIRYDPEKQAIEDVDAWITKAIVGELP